VKEETQSSFKTSFHISFVYLNVMVLAGTSNVTYFSYQSRGLSHRLFYSRSHQFGI